MSDSAPDSEPRAKRLKKDKFGRFAALQKLKELKGAKNKLEINDVDNVYETVDEKEYRKRVVGDEDDWIVDDGTGYFEDGRDIFEDDLDSESIASASKNKASTSKKRKKGISENAGKGNLQYMISNMSTKKKKEETKLEEDDVLSELISEISEGQESKAGSSKFTPTSKTVKLKSTPKASVFAEKKAAKDYMKSFSVPKKVTPLKPVPLEITSVEDSGVLKEIQNVTESEAIVKQERASPGKHEIEEVEVEKPKPQKKLFDIQPDLVVKEEEANQSNDFNFFDDDDDEDLSQVPDIGIEEKAQRENEPVKNEEPSDWEMMVKGDTYESQGMIKYDTSQLPMTTDDEGNEVLRFFWWDAYETPLKPGLVYLFGKIYNESTKTYASCCVVVKNIQRNMFVLPRPHHLDRSGTPTNEPVTIVDVYKEINELLLGLNVPEFKSRKVTKNYCFNPAIPTESEYLEIKYSASYPPLDGDTSGKTFSKIFGTHSSFLETFLLSQKIKGPCWLDITSPEPVSNPVSWCKFEINCSDPSNICIAKTEKIIPPPPLVVLTINSRMVVNPSDLKSEVVMMSCLAHHSYSVNKQAPNPPFQQHFCVISKPKDQIWPQDMHESLRKYKATTIQKMETEKALLNYFLVQFERIDPDLIVGHDLQGYQINVLAERLSFYKIANWSRLSKIRRVTIPKYNTERELFVGRLVCDIKISAKELIKARSYDLGSLCQAVLKVDEDKRIEIEGEDIPRMFSSSFDILKLVNLTMQDTAFILKIMYELNVIPLALQITNIAGNIMSKTLMGGRSERNEFLLLHAFTEKNYIVPDKAYFKKKGNQSTASRKKPTYAGGLVLDPKVGFYDKLILLMDFNSLYPSIIQEYNICFTTIRDANNEESISLPDSSLPPGILPTEIRKLVESRKGVKALMRNQDLSSDLKMQYHIRQMALKLTANSMYGCLGFANSRFYAKGLAALVTQKGREILTNTKELVQKMSYEVIYGDTDSIMINSNCLDYEQVFKVGNKIKYEINKLYKQIELDIDGVFKYLLLLKKKKYACITLSKGKNGEIVEEQELKGLDIVRRDWSQLATEAGKFILKHILSDQSPDERIENILNHLTKLKEDLEENRVPLSLLVITKQLTKDPKMYPDKNSLSHVLVALRYNQKGGRKLRAGDVVPYIICDDGTLASATQRAYHVDELKNSPKLKVDIKYYLSQQILPVISRLCEPIDGIDEYQIGNCLGIETTVKKPKVETNEIEENMRKPEVRFKNASPFSFKCKACKSENLVKAPFVDNVPFLLKCSNSTCDIQPISYLYSIKRQLKDGINSYITTYYANEMTCEDPGCENNDMVLVPTRFVGKYPVCTACEKGLMYRKYGEGDLYNQLSFFQYLFDLTKMEKKPLMESNVELAFQSLREIVENILWQSAYGEMNLKFLFSFYIDELKAKEQQIKISKRSKLDDGLHIEQEEPAVESEEEDLS